MANGLTVLSAAKDVSTALNNVVNTYYTFRTIRKQEMVVLDSKIKAFKARTYVQEAGTLIRMNIQEIANTQRFIDEKNLSGPALDLAMEQLYALNGLLKSNVNNFLI